MKDQLGVFVNHLPVQRPALPRRFRHTRARHSPWRIEPQEIKGRIAVIVVLQLVSTRGRIPRPTMRTLSEKQKSPRAGPSCVCTIATPRHGRDLQPKRPRRSVVHRQHPAAVAVKHEPAGINRVGVEACVHEQGGIDAVDTVFRDAEPDEFAFRQRAAGRPNPVPRRPSIPRFYGLSERTRQSHEPLETAPVQRHAQQRGLDLHAIVGGANFGDMVAEEEGMGLAWCQITRCNRFPSAMQVQHLHSRPILLRRNFPNHPWHLAAKVRFICGKVPHRRILIAQRQPVHLMRPLHNLCLLRGSRICPKRQN